MPQSVNPDYFGDSYDLVKRFFCHELSKLGYTVVIDAMLTGHWNGTENEFYRLIGVKHNGQDSNRSTRTALFVDPDTGVHKTTSRKHVSFEQLAQQASIHEIVFAFDQSFSRQHKAKTVMQEKMVTLETLGCHALYYDSHARFLFIARREEPIRELRTHLVSLGLPASRLLTCGT